MIQYVVDAFTDRVFAGNPAAVCVMGEWLPDETMVNIALENNLSETAFAVREGANYRLRWFTPGGEIDLCGHATLATAFVILSVIGKNRRAVSFETRSGTLAVARKGDLYEMDFPAFELTPAAVTRQMIDAIGATPIEAYLGRDLLCVFDSEETVRGLRPDMERLKAIDGLLLHATARGREFDCVSRSFAPKLNIAEDPVCGSGHCHIIPYWARAQQKQELVAHQASKRGGVLHCRMNGDRVILAGKAVLYSRAELCV